MIVHWADAEEATVVRADGAQLTGRLERWDAKGVVVQGANGASRIDLAQVRRVQIDGSAGPSAAPREEVLIVLANDDQLRAHSLTIAEEFVDFSTDSLGTSRVPLEALRFVQFAAVQMKEGPGDFLGAASPSEMPSDLALLKNGDAIRGTLVRMDGAELEMETPLGAVRLPREKLRSLSMNPDLQASLPLPGQYWLLDLADGSLLTCTEAALREKGTVRARHVGNFEIEVPVAQISSASLYGGTVVSLADRQPSAAAGLSFFGEQTNFKLNRNVRGGPLVVGKTRYLRGLGMSSYAACTFAVEPEDENFSSRVGIDSVTGGEGSVVFRVQVDGHTVWESGLVTGRSGSVTVDDISLKGAKEFSIVVDYGERADIQDVADWCDPIIVRRSAQ